MAPLALLLAVQAPRARFDYDFSALEDGELPSFVLDRATNRLLGYSQTPTVILTDSAEEERALVRQVEARKAALSGAYLRALEGAKANAIALARFAREALDVTRPGRAPFAGNRIPSNRIADADIEFTGQGSVSETQRRNVFQRVLRWLGVL